MQNVQSYAVAVQVCVCVYRSMHAYCMLFLSLSSALAKCAMRGHFVSINFSGQTKPEQRTFYASDKLQTDTYNTCKSQKLLFKQHHSRATTINTPAMAFCTLNLSSFGEILQANKDDNVDDDGEKKKLHYTHCSSQQRERTIVI